MGLDGSKYRKGNVPQSIGREKKKKDVMRNRGKRV